MGNGRLSLKLPCSFRSQCFPKCSAERWVPIALEGKLPRGWGGYDSPRRVPYGGGAGGVRLESNFPEYLQHNCHYGPGAAAVNPLSSSLLFAGSSIPCPNRIKPDRERTKSADFNGPRKGSPLRCWVVVRELFGKSSQSPFFEGTLAFSRSQRTGCRQGQARRR